MHHRVAGQRGVVGFDVQLHDVFQTVRTNEVQTGGGVEVVLMLGRLFRFWFEQELAGEADRLGMLMSHVHEAGEVVEFAFHVGVEEVVVTLAAAPEDVVLAAEFVRDFNRLLHLSGSVGKHVSVAAGRRSVHEPRVGEHVRRAPQQLDAGSFLLGFQLGGDPVQDFVRLFEARSFRSDIAIVPAVKRSAELFDEFKRDVDSLQSHVDRVGSVFPRTIHGRSTERVNSRAAERVPVADAEPQQLFHRRSAERFGSVVILVGQRVSAVRAFKFDLRNFWEVRHGVGSLWFEFQMVSVLRFDSGPLGFEFLNNEYRTRNLEGRSLVSLPLQISTFLVGYWIFGFWLKHVGRRPIARHRSANKERVHRRLRPIYPDWDDGSRSVEAPSERHSVPGEISILKETGIGEQFASKDSYGNATALCRTLFRSAGTSRFRSVLSDPKHCRNKSVYEYGRNGKANVAIAAAVVVLLLAAGLLVFLRPPRSETPIEPLRVMESGADVLTKLSLSKDGAALAAASADGDVLVWRLPGRRSTPVGNATDSPATMLNWSPDGLLLCGDSSGLLRAWQQVDLKESTVDSPRVAVTACAFRQKLAEKQMVLGLSDGRIVRIGASETTLRKSGHRGVKAMLISDDQSTLVSAGSEGKLIWYDFKQDEVVGTISEHETEIGSLNWSPDGRQLVSADWNGELRIWDAQKRKRVAEAKQPDAVSALAWIDDRVVTGSWDGRIRVWSVESNQLKLSFSIYTGQPIHDLVVESSGETAFTVSGDENVREWTLAKGKSSESGEWTTDSTDEK